MSETMKKPRIRFKGFTEAWEQRKLGEVFETVTDYVAAGSFADIAANVKYLENPDFAQLVRTMDLKNNFTSSNEVYVDKKAFEYLYRVDLNQECIILPNIGNCGEVYLVKPENLPYSHNVLGPNAILVRSKNYDHSFLSTLLLGNDFQEKLSLIISPNGQTKFNKTELKNIDIVLPLSTDEQVQIGGFFSQLDNLITLHQRKYDKLLNIKKSMLEKMFPKNGNDVPEIRFKGFTDAWEQRKLRDIYDSVGNAFVGTATPYYVEQGHFYLESNNVKDGQINYNNEIFINDEFYEKQKDKWLHTGDIVMVQSGHVGHAAVIPPKLDNTAAHALIMFRKPKEKIEPYFLIYEYQTDRTKKKIENITTGNTIKHILASDMQKFEVDIPKYEEQKVIAGYFRRLDNLITLHQRKLEKLKNIKKSMLEKMFV